MRPKTMMKSGLCLLLSALCGCSGITQPAGQEMLGQQQQKIQGLAEARSQTFSSVPLMQVEQGYFLGVQKRALTREESLPPIFDQKVVLANSQPMTLQNVAGRLSLLSGLPVRIADGLTKEAQVMPFHDGTLRRLLDSVATHYGVYWEHDDGNIRFYRVKAETFAINALSGKITIHDTITNESNAAKDSAGEGTSTGDTSGQTSQSTEVRDEMSVWEEVGQNIARIVTQNSSSEDRSTVNINRAAGTVTVISTPTVLSQVRQYVDSINAKLSRQVAIEVQIFNLETSKASDVGFSLDAVFTEMNNGFAASLLGAVPGTVPAGAGSVSAMILESTRDRSLAQWSGTNVLLQALRTYGDVSLVTTGSGITSNGQPLPIQNVNRRVYLERVSKTVTSDVGTSTELQAGTVTTGFSMMAIPQILDQGRVALQYSITLSSLDELREISSGTEAIQAPEVSTRSFMQRVQMKVGSTLVLAGFEQNRAQVGGGRGLTGAGRKGEEKHNMIIVAISVHDATGR